VGPSEEEERFLEELGLFMERAGLPRMAGRILGWLHICDPPEQSSADLAAALHASKGSISTVTRMLLAWGMIERAVVPGSRQTYFRVTPGTWSRVLHGEMVYLTGLRELGERGVALLAGAPPERRRRVEEMRDFYQFFENEFPKLIRRWDERQAGRSDG
jgi:DNA-binding transcriptional regulator GbsR (MarR family)